jgi:hypothetical protein
VSEGVHLGTWVGGACSDVEVVKELWCRGAEPVVSLCSPRGACGMRAWVLSLWLYIHLKYFFNEATSLRVSQTHTHTLSLIYYKAESLIRAWPSSNKKTDGPLFVFVLHPRTKRSPPFEHYRNEHGRRSPTPVIFFYLFSTISMSLPIKLG